MIDARDINIVPSQFDALVVAFAPFDMGLEPEHYVAVRGWLSAIVDDPRHVDISGGLEKILVV